MLFWLFSPRSLVPIQLCSYWSDFGIGVLYDVPPVPRISLYFCFFVATIWNLDRHSEQNQGGSTRRTESLETDIQQNHLASFKSEINRTDPESEQYTNEFINSIYESLTGTQTTKTKGKQKVRRFKSRKTTITNLSSFNLSEAERNLIVIGTNLSPGQLILGVCRHPLVLHQEL